MSSEMSFVVRDKLGESEWDNQRKDWRRPDMDRSVLKQLTRRSTANGIIRITYFFFLLTGLALGTLWVFNNLNPWLALVPLYAYFFVYGFLVAPAHELQHKTVFGKKQEWINELVFYFVQILIWNSPTYARISHKLHHRYTMIQGVDPETDWPEVITSRWMWKTFLEQVSRILVIGSVFSLLKDTWTQIRRTLGIKDRMMTDHCSDKEIRKIRLESLMIIVFHAGIAAVSIAFGLWQLLVFITIAWQIGSAFEQFWHNTKHIGLPYNVKDHRLNTRSVKVNWFIRSIFWGLDDHVDHHLFPAVPSRNLPELHKMLDEELRDPKNVLGCWIEMFSIARQKDRDPNVEFVPAEYQKGAE